MVTDEQSLRTKAFQLKDILQLDNPLNSVLRAEVEAEYHFLLDSFKRAAKSPETEKKEFTQDEIIEKLLPLNLEIELSGKWIWISGKTKQHKEVLKSLQCRFSPGKKCWYWRPAKYRSINKDPMDMNEIRRIYGSQKVLTH